MHTSRLEGVGAPVSLSPFLTFGGLCCLVVACNDTSKPAVDPSKSPAEAVATGASNPPPAPSLSATAADTPTGAPSGAPREARAPLAADSLSVAQAIDALHHGDIAKQPRVKLTVTGYIVATNLVPCARVDTDDGVREGCVPRCAVHKRGKADPEGCQAPYPAFVISDDRAEPNLGRGIIVVGWASNYANIFDAITAIDSTPPEKRSSRDFAVRMADSNLGVQMPDPLPAVGAKVVITGTYGSAASTPSATVASDDGVLTYQSMSTVEPGSTFATLPGMTRPKPRPVP